MAAKKTTRKATTRRRVTRKTAPKAPEEVQVRTDDIHAGDGHEIDLSSNIADEDIERPDLAVVEGQDMDDPVMQEYARDLAFMEDVLTVSIGETSDPNEENPVPCGVNGEVRYLMRGRQYKLQRKFVDSLIKQVDRVKTIQYKDHDGCDQTKVERVPANRYPIQIHHDPAGETGVRWFEHQCRNAW